MGKGLETGVLKGVSRSFYLSLRLLPAPMRRPAGIAYLLARTSDTIADSAGLSAAERLDSLGRFSRQISEEEKFSPMSAALISGTPDPREKILLERAGEVVASLRWLPVSEAALVRDVLETIVSGQRLDLEIFGNADAGNPAALGSDSDLEDYTWRVAGCVGEFWTKLGYQTMGGKFSKRPEEELMKHAADYGKSLQLVNILRDLPEDLAMGRCYLPVSDPMDEDELMGCFSKWKGVALERVEAGFSYSSKLESGRLRAASVLPAMVARETLALLDNGKLGRSNERVKVPRRRIYSMVLSALCFRLAGK